MMTKLLFSTSRHHQITFHILAIQILMINFTPCWCGFIKVVFNLHPLNLLLSIKLETISMMFSWLDKLAKLLAADQL
jgi:hypothetical protein